MSEQRLPQWLRRKPGSAQETQEIKRLLRKSSLNTVCEEARCPNISECFSRGTATFMILGDICTRGCRFCSVNTGKPIFSEQQFKFEAKKVADAVNDLNLNYVVVTSVARDDLADGGASGFVETIKAIRDLDKDVKIEILIPDLRGDLNSLEKIIEAKPDVLNHNLETVPRLYRRVRPGASYERSLKILKETKRLDPEMRTKTGIMLGLGEEEGEVRELMEDCLKNEVDIFTAGQYLRPTKEHLQVENYLEPKRFEFYQNLAEELGFKHALIAPLARSSYRAEQFLNDI
jgi:lipoic acid synthetase